MKEKEHVKIGTLSFNCKNTIQDEKKARKVLIDEGKSA